MCLPKVFRQVDFGNLGGWFAQISLAVVGVVNDLREIAKKFNTECH